MEATKRRRPIVAVLLSLLLPGLGHVYCGMPVRGIAFYLGMWVLIAVVGLSGLIAGFSGLLAAVAIFAAYQVFIVVEAAIQAARLKEMHLNWYNRWYVYIAAIFLFPLTAEQTLLPIVQFRIVGLRTFKMPASSMQPALEPGDHVMAKLRPYGNGIPQRGDVVVFVYPLDKTKDFLKRVIGLPGERLEIKDKQVIVNGQRLEDPWGVHTDSRTLPIGDSPRDNLPPTTIPDGSVFVLGDNRDYSHDSRFWGCVEIKDIHAKPLFIYWSDDFKRLGKRF